jgi:hypothetical protein
MGSNGRPAYEFVVDKPSTVVPDKGKDGQFVIRIHCGGKSADDEYAVCRYFALNALDVLLFNDGELLGSYHVDRHRKLGYRTDSYESLDTPDTSVPHFLAPLGEQEDVYEMIAVLPGAWFEKKRYDWSKNGSVSISISSIWKGFLAGHSYSFAIPLPSAKTDNEWKGSESSARVIYSDPRL